jgi:hypothetical protein
MSIGELVVSTWGSAPSFMVSCICPWTGLYTDFFAHRFKSLLLLKMKLWECEICQAPSWFRVHVKLQLPLAGPHCLDHLLQGVTDSPLWIPLYRDRSVRIAGVPTDIQTKHLLITCLEFYCFVPLCRQHCDNWTPFNVHK